MDYDEDKIRWLVIMGLKNPDPWRVELEPVNFGERLGVFYTPASGAVRRESVDTKGRTNEQIAFALLMSINPSPVPEGYFTEAPEPELPPPTMLQKAMDGLRSLYEGKRGKHPNNCTCSKHLKADGA